MDEDKNSLRKVKKEFYKITRILPIHRTNFLEEKEIRKDIIFDFLAEKVFDNPELLDFLSKKIKKWLSWNKTEFTYCLAGYIYYIKDDFTTASRYFLNAIQKNPQNLDNWFDLAFSLYHQGQNKHNLGKGILFNFDYCLEFFKDKKVNLKTLETALKKAVEGCPLN